MGGEWFSRVETSVLRLVLLIALIIHALSFIEQMLKHWFSDI